MSTIYQPSTSPTMTVTVVAPTVTYPTALSLVISAPSVVAGAPLTAIATLTATEASAVPLADETITLTCTPAIGSTFSLVATTDAKGVASFDLTGCIATSTATVGGYGGWKFVASFAGATE